MENTKTVLPLNQNTEANFNIDRNILESLPNSVLFEEVAHRMQKAFKRTWGKKFSYGSFNWKFHNGKFVHIEEHPKDRLYEAARL